MSLKNPVSIFIYAAVCLAMFLSACASAATPSHQSPAELATPTPEVFTPLNPSPTPSDSSLPMTCQVTDLNVYINKEWGYCFAYPLEFALDESRGSEGIITLFGPALDDYADPIRVSLEVATQPVPDESVLSSLVDAYLASFQNAMPVTITREPWSLGSESAEKLEPIPGLLSSRLVMALHDNLLFTLRFHPSDIELAKPGLDDLTQTVSGSFAFLDGISPPASRQQTVSWFEFGKDISLTYDSILAPWVEAQTVPAVPPNDQDLFAAFHPEYARFRFLGFQGGRKYELPAPVEDRVAQVIVYQTADFPGYGDDSPQGFVSQLELLKNLLETGVDPAQCSQLIPGGSTLPFLPWTNAQQTFCVQPKIIEFPGGKGIRYLTYYSQDPSPVLDQRVFYTFQGLTEDGQFYVSAFFPVGTGVFPSEPPPCPKCGESDYNPFPEWEAVLAEQLIQVNALPADKFDPSLTVLDQLVQSIQIGK